MKTRPDLAETAGLIGDQTRATVLCALASGIALPATDLARRARVTAPTMSAHLTRLVEGGLLEAERQGRHRYYRLANADVAAAIEALVAISPGTEFDAMHEPGEVNVLSYARTCYDHLAGKVGVAITDALSRRRLIRGSKGRFDLQPSGERWLEDLGIDVDAARAQRRKFANACLDWSERQPHLGGAIGAALAARLLDRGWFERYPRTRALKLTAKGRQGLRRELGIEL